VQTGCKRKRIFLILIINIFFRDHADGSRVYVDRVHVRVDATWTREFKNKNKTFLEIFGLLFEGLYLMQFFFIFRTFFFIEWVFKSRLSCKERTTKSSYYFSLADGMANGGPASVWMLGDLIDL
jgi:hypothetical protein